MTDSDKERLNELESKVLQLQIDSLQKRQDDQEKRLRIVEDVATRFNFLMTLAIGGGALSAVNLILTLTNAR